MTDYVVFVCGAQLAPAQPSSAHGPGTRLLPHEEAMACRDNTAQARPEHSLETGLAQPCRPEASPAALQASTCFDWQTARSF